LLSPPAAEDDEDDDDVYGYLRSTQPSKPENPKVKIWLDSVVKQLHQNPADDAAQEEFDQISRMITREMVHWRARDGSKSPPFSSEVPTIIVTMAVELGKRDILFSEIYRLCFALRSRELFQLLGVALLRFKLESLLPELVYT